MRLAEDTFTHLLVDEECLKTERCFWLEALVLHIKRAKYDGSFVVQWFFLKVFLIHNNKIFLFKHMSTASKLRQIHSIPMSGYIGLRILKHLTLRKCWSISQRQTVTDLYSSISPFETIGIFQVTCTLVSLSTVTTKSLTGLGTAASACVLTLNSWKHMFTFTVKRFKSKLSDSNQMKLLMILVGAMCLCDLESAHFD